ncbi:ibr finger domain protein [Fusarium flagelliforme]|uniref:RBR-type E3 ubiquitin transferase n=1 Tax=Fusarium flagelliforme TaxID=2675880 RepID=A0A395MT80_9HYPO|nr:ibr finger domain protein [Fusarium flagelliforme]
MDESLILALSIAEAVQADEAILEQYRLEDQAARDFMLAQALNENRQATIEPLNNQPFLDEETLTALRLLNTAPPGESESGDEGNEELRDPVAESAEDKQVTLHTGSTGETQDAHVAEHTPDNTEDTDDTPEVETLKQQPEEPSTSQQATVEQEEVVAQVDDDDQQAQQHQEESHEPCDLVAPIKPESTALIVNTKSTTPSPAPEMKQCIVCGDDHPDTGTLETLCSHDWCQGCLVDYVERSMEDESLFPPKCCNRTISIEQGGFFSQEVLERFQEKTVEFGTVDRTYCNDIACSTFISPQSIEEGTGIARCSRCEKQTCASCKKEWHEGVCPKDKETQAVVRLGERQGWRKCDKCNHLIQRSTGCNHMTCRCKHQFCYRCGAEWRTCPCPLWELAELLDQPAQAAAGNGERAVARLRPIAALVNLITSGMKGNVGTAADGGLTQTAAIGDGIELRAPISAMNVPMK